MGQENVLGAWLNTGQLKKILSFPAMIFLSKDIQKYIGINKFYNIVLWFGKKVTIPKGWISEKLGSRWWVGKVTRWLFLKDLYAPLTLLSHSIFFPVPLRWVNSLFLTSPLYPALPQIKWPRIKIKLFCRLLEVLCHN